MRAIDVERIIRSDGWVYKNTRGGHKHFIHPTKPGKVTVPQHPGDNIGKVFLNKIMKQAGIK
ncbi:MAG: type II toxin-antitoxin system HicA family toxin [Oscillospiraceae bacterium]|jgi:predicted RNA binding protein YcfA (HicA-like mRNA interferase family)|nr:type II toxin-antitoxin system HicA family toxin [Oscillospiraceae bacterium]